MGLSTLKSIWQFIANLFGYKTKQEEIDSKDFIDISKVNFTAIFALKLANKSLSDSKIQVVGESDRAKFLNDSVYKLRRYLPKVVQSMLGYGGVVVVPYVAENEIFFDVVNQDNLIIGKSVGDKIKDCSIIADSFQDVNGNIFYRIVRYVIENEVLTIHNFAMRGEQIISISNIAEWADIQELIIIRGVKKMPFAFFKCPKDNKKGISIKGVPITFGSDDTIKQIHDLLLQVKDEYEQKEVKVFVDSILFDQDKKLSKRYERVMGNGQDNLIDIYSPDIREMSFYTRLEHLLRQLEQEVGVNDGIITKFESNSDTAYEIKANQGDTYALVCSIREELEHGIQYYVEACEFLSNYYNLSRFGEYKIFFDWGYNIVENTTETFAQMIQGQAVGAVSTAEIRQFIFNNENLEEAEKKVQEIKQQEPSIKDLVGLTNA